MSEYVHIKLTGAEALLVFKALVWLDEKKLLDSAVGEEGRIACRALEAVLEKTLSVFSPDYPTLVEQAKHEIKGEDIK